MPSDDRNIFDRIAETVARPIGRTRDAGGLVHEASRTSLGCGKRGSKVSVKNRPGPLRTQVRARTDSRSKDGLRMRSFALLSLSLTALAGCTAPAPTPSETTDFVDASVTIPAPFLVKLQGNVVFGVLDVQNHDQPTEQAIFPFQKAGWNLQIDDVPQAIEVRVDWTGDGEFMLHPHWLKGDEAGRTKYYGYHSPTYDTGTGCIRLPEEDLTTGVWPMMVHPGFQTTNTAFTITVGIVGADATVRPELHGHRADGMYDIEEHKVGECQFLNG